MGANSTKIRSPSNGHERYFKKNHRNYNYNNSDGSSESGRNSISSNSSVNSDDGIKINNVDNHNHHHHHVNGENDESNDASSSNSNNNLIKKRKSTKKKAKISFLSSNLSSSTLLSNGSNNNNDDNNSRDNRRQSENGVSKPVAYRMVENRKMLDDVENPPTEVYPVDDDDADRQQTMHFVQKEFRDGKCFLAPVNQLLDSGDGIKVLDVGCGSGVWVLDMATRYPEVEFVGLDIMIQNSPSEIKPKNTSFIVGNVLNGLSFRSNTFDYVFIGNMRTSFTVDDWPSVIDELIRVTKPGGWLEISDSDILFHGCGPLASDYLARVKKKLMTKFNMTLEPMSIILKHIDSIVASNPNLITDIDLHKKELPIGKQGGKVCEIYGDTIKWCAQNARITLENLDLTAEEYKEMVDKAFEEFDSHEGQNIGFSIVAKKNRNSD